MDSHVSNSLTIHSNAYKVFQQQTYNIENWIMELLQVEYLDNKDRQSYNEKGGNDRILRLTDYLDLNKKPRLSYLNTRCTHLGNKNKPPTR